MRTFYFFLLFCSFTGSLFAQTHEWANYVNDGRINCIALEGDFLWIGSQAGLTKINRITSERQTFLPSNSGLRGFGVRSIYIAPDGVKWLGGESGGLMRFDGVNWQQYNYINTGDTLIQISKLKAAPNGDLWMLSTINSYCGGCSRFIKFDGNTFTRLDEMFGPFNPLNGAGPVRDFDIAPGGDIWVLADEKIQRFDGASIVESYPVNEVGLEDYENVQNVLIGPNGVPIVVTNKGYTSKVWQLNGSEWVILPINGANSTDGNVNSIFMDAYNNLWINSKTSSNGAVSFYYKFDGFSWEIWSSDALPNVPAAQPYAEPRLIKVDEEGHWWFYHYTLGGIHAPKVFEFDGANWTGFDTEFFPLASVGPIEDVEFDCEGNIWFGGNPLTQFNGTDWNDITLATPPSAHVFSITKDTNSCDLWITFNDGSSSNIGFAKYDGTTFTNYTTPSGSDVFKVLIGANGDIWVASSSDGLGHFNGNNWEWFNQNNSPIANYVVDIALDQEGRLWATSLNKGVSVYENGTWATFNSANSPVQDIASWLYVDQSDNIWVSNGGSPLKFDGINWSPFPVNSGTGYDGIYCMVQDLSGNLWFGSFYAVYKYDGNNLITYNIENSNIGANLAFNIKVDVFNNKWFAHGFGVSVFNENGITNLPVNPPNTTTSTTQIDNLTASLLIYPNPNNGSFIVEVNGDGPWTATVSDVAGRQVKAVEAVGKIESFEGLWTGFYFVAIWQNGKVTTQKIVVGQ